MAAALLIFDFDEVKKYVIAEPPSGINIGSYAIREMEDGIMSYMDSNETADKEYDEMVEDIMNANTTPFYPWRFFDCKPVKIDSIHTFWIE